jgi:hypothetical protein
MASNLLKFSLPLGITLTLTEGGLNNLVRKVNGGFMPVAVSKNMIITTVGRIPMTSSTHLKFLADIIRINNRVFSIGDLLGYVGFVLFCVGIVYWGIVVARGLITRMLKEKTYAE